MTPAQKTFILSAVEMAITFDKLNVATLEAFDNDRELVYETETDYSEITSAELHELAAMMTKPEAQPEPARVDLLVALERAELSTTQIRMVTTIGRQSVKKRADWMYSQLERLGKEIRQAIDAHKAATK